MSQLLIYKKKERQRREKKGRKEGRKERRKEGKTAKIPKPADSCFGQPCFPFKSPHVNIFCRVGNTDFLI
jgi:hypothetical protein